MNSIELFSGTGGLALGLQQAGFDHMALFEWDKASCENIKENIANGYPGVRDWKVYQTDVRTVNYNGYTEYPTCCWRTTVPAIFVRRKASGLQ